MTETVNKEKEGFERAFDLVGGHGKFQWFILAVASLELVFLTWNHIGYIFIGAVPNHWCKVDELQNVSWSRDLIKELAIPRSGSNEFGAVWKYDSCNYYDYDYKDLVKRSNGSFSNALNIVAQLNIENKKTKECLKWEYDNSMYSSTITTDYNLVCGRRYLAATTQSSYMIGGLAGTFTFGVLNDRILGRRNSALISIVIVLVGGFLATLSTSYWIFVALRMCIAFGTAGCMQAANVLLVEHCDIASRAKFYCISGAFFGVGYAIMSVYAYFLRSWASLQLAFSLTTLILLSYFWIFPESPRWLASKGKDEEAIKCLQRICKINGKPEPKKTELLSIVQSCHQHHREDAENKAGLLKKFTDICSNIKSLVDTRERCKRTLTVWVLFFIVAFVYYGFAFSTNLTSNPYILVALAGLMEIPACIVPAPFLSMWGRLPTTVTCYFLTGVFAIAIAITPPEYEVARIVFTLSGKFFVAAAFNVIYLVVAEIYPTVSRTTGQSASTMMGRLGSILAPYAADLLSAGGIAFMHLSTRNSHVPLQKGNRIRNHRDPIPPALYRKTTVYPDLPCVIFGIVSIIGAAIALLLPEMKDMDMLDQVSQLELQQI